MYYNLGVSLNLVWNLSPGLAIADSREERLRRPEYFKEG